METTGKTPQEARATDRVLDALSALAALIDQSIKEVKALDSDFQNRLLQAVHAAESSLQNQASEDLEKALGESRAKLAEQFNAKLAEVSAEWEAERSRLNAEVDRLTQAAKQWETERKRLTGEIERLAQVQAATLAEAEKAFAAAKAAASSAGIGKPGGAAVKSEAVLKEVERVETLIKEISAVIEDPATELSTVIRKNVERAELESYLKGIRYALNGSSPK